MSDRPPKVCPGDDERGCVVYIAPWQDRCHFCARTVALRQLARRGLPAVVVGEEEIGEQRLCARCLEWWPSTDEFFLIRPDARRGNVWHSRICRACRLSTGSPQEYSGGVRHLVGNPATGHKHASENGGSPARHPTKEGGAPVTLLRAAR